MSPPGYRPDVQRRPPTRSTIVLGGTLGLLVLGLVAGDHTGAIAGAGGSRSHDQHVAAPDGEATPEPPRDSLYHLEAVLQDQAGGRGGLDVFRGHPVLVSMFYASCPDACPLLIHRLRQLESDLPAAARAEVRVVLVSLDPERDTPAILSRLARRHGVDGSRWRFLTAPDDVVREVAAVLGVKFRRRPGGVINHSTIVALLDRSGVIDTRGELFEPATADRLAERLLLLSSQLPR